MSDSDQSIVPGSLEAIWIKPGHRQPMAGTHRAELIAREGLVGNINQKSKRQITILSRESWQAATSTLDHQLDPSLRRANLLVSGVDLENSRGKTLQVGECRIALFGETRPCRRMDEAFPGLQNALDPNWSGGAYGVVLDSGTIEVGDAVVLS